MDSAALRMLALFSALAGISPDLNTYLKIERRKLRPSRQLSARRNNAVDPSAADLPLESVVYSQRVFQIPLVGLISPRSDFSLEDN